MHIYFHYREKGKTPTEIEVKVTTQLKRHVFINLKFAVKLANNFHQVISDTDKLKYFLIFI